MAKISTYPSADNPLSLSDRLIGTEAIRLIPSSTPLATKNFSLGELLQLFSSNFPAASLQEVLNTGNTATQNITLIGTIDTTLIKPDNIEDTSGSQGLTFQFLSKGTSSINWVDLPISNLQSVLNTGNTATQNITLIGDITSTKIIPRNIQDDVSSIGTTGQILSKSASGIKWINNPILMTPGLADVLSVGNIANNTIQVNSFIKTDGLSTEYLMADGSVTTGSGSQNLQQVTDIGATTTNPISVVNTAPNSLNFFTNVFDGRTGLYLRLDDATAKGIAIVNNDSSGTFPFTFSQYDGDVTTTLLTDINDLGEITAPKLIKRGGTSSQYLMADGSTSLGSGGTVTGVTAISPIISSGGIAPIISTSMATNKLIGRSTTGTGVMEQITIGSGLTLSGGTLNNTATPTALGYYGAFQDMLTQTLATANVGQPFLIRTTDESNEVSITTNGSGQYTRITPANTGVYNIQWSGQFQNPDNAIHDINVWFRKGLTSSSGPGTDIVGSNGLIAMPARKSAAAGDQGHIVAGWNFLLTIAVGEYVEFYWMSDTTQVTLQAYPAGSPPPSTASLIVTVTQQSGIMAGTGITAINSLTGASQTLTTGTTGTDFAVVESGTDHKFNLPDASATARGVVTTGAQTFAGAKTFSPSVTASGAIAKGTTITPTLTAAANNDVLVGLDIAPTFTNGAFTGVGNYALRLAGTIVNTSQLVLNTINNNSLTFQINSTERSRFFSTTGNFILQNGGTFTDVASSRLTINSTTQGFLLPRMTNTQRIAIASPAIGLNVYDTTNNLPAFYNGTDWNYTGNTGTIIVTSGTSFTTPSNITTATVFIIELVGAGGGAGGAGASGTTASGGGGGGGGYVYIKLSGLTPSSTYTCAIGVGGTGGTGANNGTAGSSTTLQIGATTYTASGGGAGGFGIASSGGAGGTGTSGSINITGQNGQDSPSSASSAVLSAAGGNSPKGWGDGGSSVIAPKVGNVGTGYGGGGSSTKSSTVISGAGTNGIIYCTYYN